MGTPGDPVTKRFRRFLWWRIGPPTALFLVVAAWTLEPATGGLSRLAGFVAALFVGLGVATIAIAPDLLQRTLDVIREADPASERPPSDERLPLPARMELALTSYPETAKMTLAVVAGAAVVLAALIG